MKRKDTEFALVLGDIRSAYNVGAMFRTADAAGVSAIFLTGFSPTPKDRFGRARRDIAKAALGAERTVPWNYIPRQKACLASLKKAGFFLVALEQHERAVSYRRLRVRKKMALIVGNETRGLPEDVIALCDAVIAIPMRGAKESLNVSVAAGIALFQLLRI